MHEGVRAALRCGKHGDLTPPRWGADPITPAIDMIIDGFAKRCSWWGGVVGFEGFGSGHCYERPRPGFLFVSRRPPRMIPSLPSQNAHRSMKVGVLPGLQG